MKPLPSYIFWINLLAQSNIFTCRKKFFGWRYSQTSHFERSKHHSQSTKSRTHVYWCKNTVFIRVLYPSKKKLKIRKTHTKITLFIILFNISNILVFCRVIIAVPLDHHKQLLNYFLNCYTVCVAALHHMVWLDFYNK